MSRGTVSLLKRGKYRIKTTNKGVLKHYKVESVPVEWLPLRKPWEWLKISG